MFGHEDELQEKINSLCKENKTLREALEFYAAFASGKNYQFIFDDESSSRAEVYERYKKCSIGTLGLKAREALEETINEEPKATLSEAKEEE